MRRIALLRGWAFNRALREMVSALPYSALLPLALAIASLFSILGPVTDVIRGGRMAASPIVQMTTFSAVIAVAYAFASLRQHYRLLPVLAAVNIAWAVFAPRGYLGTYPLLPAATAGARLQHDGGVILLLTIASYMFFLWFLNGTAGRYLRVRAEMELARQIHQGLVPPLAVTIAGFEFVGLSIPSGEVGGDLVDVVPLQDGHWFGYVADVSGHGVSSGVVMGMFKSALRMRLRQSGPLAALLADLNAVLYPLKNSAMYVTLVCVRDGGDGSLDYAVAGHLPILRVRPDGTVDEVTTPQIPIGMFETYAFTSASMACAPGDLLALITDGLTEVFDPSDQELGLEAIKTLLGSMAGRPLSEIADAIVARARAHGTQLDDQTLLLARRQNREGGR